jgi:dynein regulatory complex protein 1
MDSSKHGMSKSELHDDGQMSHSTARNENQALKDNFFKVKNVFDILISEAEFLIDDKSFQMCEGKSKQEQFLILIDSCRKSLSIESMDDVEMLVETFYEFGDKKKLRIAEEEEKRLSEKEENQSNGNQAPVHGGKDGKKGDKNGKDVKKDVQEPHQEEEEDEEEKDPNKPDLDLDDVIECLEEFHQKRELKLVNQDNFVNPQVKKKSSFQTEEQKLETQKRQERMFWERMTKVLSDKGYALWRALDKALTKYYALLVERQNLIEETGLLNQQNEELKTLLNQYLQAGVNHDLQVPPTQVIRLDI